MKSSKFCKEGVGQLLNLQKNMSGRHSYENIKANFDSIYSSNSPVDYFRELHGLDYIIPEVAKGVFQGVISAIEEIRGRPVSVLDVGCSYGVNAALLKFPLDFERLARRYGDLEAAGLDISDLVALDEAYFRGWPTTQTRVAGLDVSAHAVDYARRVGLLDAGVVADLEREDLSAEDAREVGRADLIISTGCIGYVGEKTFERLLDARAAEPPWIASFVLRMVDFAALERAFAARGLVTERLEGVTFVQRRFRSREEFDGVLAALRARGIDPAGKEEEGLYHAEFFLTRPAGDADALPLGDIVSVSRGADRRFGRRYTRGAKDDVRFGL